MVERNTQIDRTDIIKHTRLFIVTAYVFNFMVIPPLCATQEYEDYNNDSNSTNVTSTPLPCPCPNGESWCPQPPDGICPCLPGTTTGPNGQPCHTPPGKKGKGLLGGPAETAAGVMGGALTAGIVGGIGFMLWKRHKAKQRAAHSIPVYHVVGVDERSTLLQHADAPPMYETENKAFDKPPTYGTKD